MTGRQFTVWFLVCWVITCIPLFLLHGLPGVDTPNHAARIHVLAHFAENPAYADFYRPRWTIIPNLGMDLVLTPLARIIPTLLAMKLFICLVFGLFGTGFAWLNRELTGKWSVWGLMGFALCYGYISGFGFWNYLFGLGLALNLLAFQHRLQDRPIRHGILLAIGCPILVLTHLMAFVLFLAAYVLLHWLTASESKKGWGGFIAGMIAAVALVAVSPTAKGQAPIYYDSAVRHITTLVSPLLFGDRLRDYAWEIMLLAGVLIGCRTKVLKIDRRALLMGGIFIVLALISPHQAMTSAYISSRMPIWALLLLGACSEGFAIPLVVPLVLLTLRSADLSQRFVSYNPVLDTLRRDLNQIPEGSLVYQAAHGYANTLSPRGWHPSLLHTNCLLLLDKPVFVSNLFTLPSQQPILNSPGVGGHLLNRYPQYNLVDSLRYEVGLARKHLAQMPDRNLAKRPGYLYFVKLHGMRMAHADCPYPILVNQPEYIIVQFQ